MKRRGFIAAMFSAPAAAVGAATMLVRKNDGLRVWYCTADGWKPCEPIDITR